jgi:hypothetical protein
MAELVYFLCALASLICAALLLRKYKQTRVRLLFWSSACFICFALNSVLLFVDLVIFPTTLDLSIPRNITSLLGLVLLLYGMIYDTP